MTFANTFVGTEIVVLFYIYTGIICINPTDNISDLFLVTIWNSKHEKPLLGIMISQSIEEYVNHLT